MYTKLLSPVARFFTTALPLDRDILSKAESLNIFIPPELESACLKRKEEFTAGRYSASRALQYFEPDHAYKLGIHSDRSPVWPHGYVGSITHAQAFAAAAVAKARDLRGLGIDSEIIIAEENAGGISKNVLTNRELKLYSETVSAFLKISEYVCLFFSAKESIYKCLSPLTQTILNFSDVEIAHFDFEGHCLKFRLLKNLTEEFSNGYEISVNFQFTNRHVHTAVELKV